jgi:hypothetical protein
MVHRATPLAVDYLIDEAVYETCLCLTMQNLASSVQPS